MIVPGDLVGIAVELHELLGAHARRLEPFGNVDVAKLIGVDERLAGAGAGRRTRVRERIADDDDALRMRSRVCVEIDRAHLERTDDVEGPVTRSRRGNVANSVACGASRNARSHGSFIGGR